MDAPVTTHYLELRAPSELRPAAERDDLRVVRAEVPSPPFARFLYATVGGPWSWGDRLAWTDDEWTARLSSPAVQLWVGYTGGVPAGYFELERDAEGGVEIVSFGLVPHFIGRGLGGALLNAAVRRAWEMDAGRVWLHTCTLDGAAALPNYQARGFRLYHSQTAPVPPKRPEG